MYVLTDQLWIDTCNIHKQNARDANTKSYINSSNAEFAGVTQVTKPDLYSILEEKTQPIHKFEVHVANSSSSLFVILLLHIQVELGARLFTGKWEPQKKDEWRSKEESRLKIQTDLMQIQKCPHDSQGGLYALSKLQIIPVTNKAIIILHEHKWTNIDNNQQLTSSAVFPQPETETLHDVSYTPPSIFAI